jgi:hypothetical protein
MKLEIGGHKIEFGRRQVPTAESVRNDDLNWANVMVGDHSIAERLGMTSEGREIFEHYVATNLVRTRIYDMESMLGAPAILKNPEKAIKRLEVYRVAEQALIATTAGMVEKFKPESSMLVRVLELAANDLIARNTSDAQNNPFHSRVSISSEFVSTWLLRWSNEINRISNTGSSQTVTE